MRERSSERIICRAMTTVLLLDDHGIIARPPRLSERLEARWRRAALDRELADGARPETCGSLALHAHALVGPCIRSDLARAVRAILREARNPSMSHVPLRRAAVLAAAEELELLARRLDAPAPVAARGVAEVRLLLSDGSGPLYFRGAAAELRSAVARARRELEVRHASA